MKKTTAVVILAFLFAPIFSAVSQAQTSAHWPQWRGPFFNGMARGDGPTTWSDTSNIKWKTEIPGRGHSTPAIWGDRIFLTTAVAVGKPAATPAPMKLRRRTAVVKDNDADRAAALVQWSNIVSTFSASIARPAKSSGNGQPKPQRHTKAIIARTAASPPTHPSPTANTFTPRSARVASTPTTSTAN